jgi:hypothetical protein
MAIDTRAKRQNVAHCSAPLPVSVLPSGADSSFERGQNGWVYGPLIVSIINTNTLRTLLLLGVGQ